MSRRTRLLLVLGLAGAVFVAAAAAFLFTGAGVRASLGLADRYLPVTVAARGLEGSWAGGLRARRLELGGEGWSARLEALELRLQLPALLRGRLQLRRLAARELALETSPAASGAPVDPGQGLPSLELPLAVRLERLELGAIRLGGALLAEDLAMAGSLEDGRLQVRELGLRRQQATLSLSGEIDATAGFRHRLDATLAGARATLDLAMAGDAAATDLTAFSTPPGLRLELALAQRAGRWEHRGHLVAEAGALLPAPEVLTLDFEGTGEASRFGFTARQGEERLLGEQGRLAWDREGLQLQRLGLRAPDRALALVLRGRLARGGGWQLDGELSGAPGGLPLGGRLEASGDLERFEARGAGSLAGAGWRLETTGDPRGLEALEIGVTTHPGELALEGRVGWSDELAWSASLEGRGLDPSSLATDWPGELDFSGSASGEGSRYALHIPRIRGSLRGRSLAGELHLAGEASALDPLELKLASGEDRLALTGSWQPGDPRLQAALDLGDLGAWLPGAAGRVTAGAELDHGRLRIDARAAALAGMSFEAEALAIEGQLALDPGRDSDLELDLAGAAFRGIPVRRLDARLRGPRSALDAVIEADLQSLGEMRAAARLDVASMPRHARVRTLVLRHPDYGRWDLDTPMAISAGEGRLAIAPTCLGGGGGRVCFRADLAPGQAGSAAAELRGLRLALLDSLAAGAVGEPVRLAGELDGALRIETAGLSWSRFDASLQARELSLAELGTATPQLRLDQLTLAAGGSADALEASLEARGPMGELVSRAALDDPLLPIRSWREGQLRLQVPDLSPLAPVLPAVAGLEGTLGATLRFSGPVDSPQLAGQGRIDALALQLPELGSAVRDGFVAFDLQEDGEARLQGSLPVDGKPLRIEGRGRPGARDAPWLEVAIAGERLPLASTPELRLVASPDLRASLRPGTLELRGELRLDEALIRTLGTAAAVPTSPDVVVQSEARGAAPTGAGPYLDAAVDVILGDDVRFEGFGLDARLGGRLRVIERPGRRPLGSGELTLSGRYRAWGQDLKIEDGRFLFAGTPLENPALNLRATRRIDEVIAGVRVTGTAREPGIEVYSEPPMEQTRALSYLLLGRPPEGSSTPQSEALANAALALAVRRSADPAAALGTRLGFDQFGLTMSEDLGGAALAVGRYLAPDLYLRYSVGLLEATDLLEISYRLSERWSLETRVGGETRGALRFSGESRRRQDR